MKKPDNITKLIIFSIVLFVIVFFVIALLLSILGGKSFLSALVFSAKFWGLMLLISLIIGAFEHLFFKDNGSSKHLSQKQKKIFSLICGFIISAVLIFLYYGTNTFTGDDIYRYGSIVLQFYTICMIFNGIKYIINKIRKSERKTEKTFIQKHNYMLKNTIYIAPTLIIICIFVCVFTSTSFKTAINFHSLEKESTGGIYGYNVIIKSELGKKYTLPAKINIDTIRDEYEDDDGNYHKKANRTYIIHNIYFKSNQFLYFEDGLIFYDLKDTCFETDQNGRSWETMLTNQYANCEFIEDKIPINTKDSLYFIVQITFSLIFLIMFFVKDADFLQKPDEKTITLSNLI